MEAVDEVLCGGGDVAGRIGKVEVVAAKIFGSDSRDKGGETESRDKERQDKGDDNTTPRLKDVLIDSSIFITMRN